MDEADFHEAVEVARHVREAINYLLQDPSRSLANLARREFDGDVLPAWIEEAEDRDRRSKIAAAAVNQIDPSRRVEVPKRRCPNPEMHNRGNIAARNIAALAAMWFLCERRGLETPTRNRSKGPAASAEGGSVCDAVGVAMGWNYKNAERIWSDRAKIFRRHPLLVMTLWAELPSTAYLGVPERKNY